MKLFSAVTHTERFSVRIESKQSMMSIPKFNHDMMCCCLMHEWLSGKTNIEGSFRKTTLFLNQGSIFRLVCKQATNSRLQFQWALQNCWQSKIKIANTLKWYFLKICPNILKFWLKVLAGNHFWDKNRHFFLLSFLNIWIFSFWAKKSQKKNR